jgi:glycosyltransferase involved in cell wall biosynthesis
MPKNCKVLLVSPGGVGGVQSFCVAISEGFRGAGHRPCILFEHSGETQGPDPVTPAGVHSSVFSYSPFDNLYRVLTRMTEFIESGGFDFVYANTSAVAYRALGLLGPRRPMAIGGCTGNNPHDHACNVEFADYLDHIFSVSSQGAQVLKERLAGRGVGISVIPHGVQPASAAPPQPRSDMFQLVFAGRFATEKRIQDLLAVAHRLREMGVRFRLTLAGDGPLRQEMQKQVERLQLRDSVRLLGFVSPAEIVPLMEASHINLLLSEAEGFGLSVLEGMNRGCVPIVTETCGCRDVISDGVNGFVVRVGAVESVASLVRQVDQDRAALASMSEDARRTVKESFSSEKELARHLEILRLAQEHHERTAAQTLEWKYKSLGLLNQRWVPNWLALSLRRLKYGGGLAAE